jgi:lipoprotein-anchoring transpeptidase ErfK/SrfK
MPETVKTYRERGITLPPTVPYGHPEHMLGAFKMVLSHQSTRYRFGGAYSIHGCKDESTVGRRVSGGCVRLRNQEGMELARLVQSELAANREVRVLIEE